MMSANNRPQIKEEIMKTSNIGCEFCSKFDFSSATVEVTKYTAHIHLALCNTKFSKEEQFNFCPICGKSLKEGGE